MRHDRKFKNYLINRNAQLRLLRPFAMIALTQSVIFGVIFLHIVSQFEHASETLPESSPAFERLFDTMVYWMSIDFLIGVEVIFGFGLLVSLFYSHRIYGAAFAIEKFLKSIIDGQIKGNLVLRETDELQALAGPLNKVKDMLLEKQRLTSSGQPTGDDPKA